ncbi:MAG TPA: YbaL family putative K(+) efflux transporter [Thermomonas sp.]|jgi:monovalent cation:H+ antiporter-2, CPA2 family|uniref:YbaL family putative K(+) efflux transporter n=1 Tax=Thermomonas sp. TaxID=1971895 RepID=UPI002CED2736|nr:YbaL family putative K(+) efflux transporter [Thermomonas sp.]HOZ24793.1 YbaL family putative K(+) efflux transporter [Thermomonas sp.]HPW13446.1 YbaL family putative K(+) efflux transporter [Thermomonas sp.]
MPHHTSLIALLCVGFVMAFALGMLAQRLKLSPLVGYLLAGVIVGPFTPGFVADQTLAPQLAEVGVILLMFGVGLHFSLRDLLDVKNIAVPGALLQIAFVTSIGTAFGLMLGWETMGSIVFGLSLSVASTVVVMRAMEDRRLLDTRRGRIAIGWLIVEDLAMVLALVLLPAIAGALGAGEKVGTAGILGALGWTLLKVAAFVAFMLVVGRRVIPRVLEHVAGLGSRELFTLCVLAIALGVAFGAAALFDVSFALGAFFAGMLLNESELSHKAAADSLPMRDAFAVLFFVSVGMLFNPSILVDHPLLVVATVAIIVFGNALIGFTVVRLFRLPQLTALTIAASLSQIGEFSFILAGLGLSQKVLPQQGHDLILAGALLSIIANPLLFAWLDRWQKRQQPGEAVTQVLADNSEVPEDMGGHAIVVGYGRVGRELSRLLQDRGVPLVLVESDPDRVEQARNRGLVTVRGNAASEAILKATRPDTAQLAILAIPQALEAGEIIARFKAMNPAISVLARAHSEAEVKHLLEHGADAAVLAERELAYSLADMVMATPPYRPARVEPAAAS